MVIWQSDMSAGKIALSAWKNMVCAIAIRKGKLREHGRCEILKGIG